MESIQVTLLWRGTLRREGDADGGAIDGKRERERELATRNAEEKRTGRRKVKSLCSALLVIVAKPVVDDQTSPPFSLS